MAAEHEGKEPSGDTEVISVEDPPRSPKKSASPPRQSRPAPHKETKQQGSRVGRMFSWLFVRLSIVGLICVVLYLLSVLNHGKYRFRSQGDTLLIERGRFLPLGFESYVPNDASMTRAYTPIQIPPGESIASPPVFDDRGGMDQALFALLAGWMRQEISSEDPKAMERATHYVERAELLPAISEEQRAELRRLRADLAYRNGQRMVDQVVDILNAALAEFELSLKLGTSKQAEVETWVREIKQRIQAYQRSMNETQKLGGNPVSPSLEPVVPQGGASDPAPREKPEKPTIPNPSQPSSPQPTERRL